MFASEMVGAVRGIDPKTGHNYDDTKKYVDKLKVSDADKKKIFETNVYKVYPRIVERMKKVGLA
jgi:4-oxalmesaconate hydratase